MRPRIDGALLAASLCLAASVPGRAAAQAMETFGMGSRSTAMGGAVTADVRDFSANFYNPAGLVRSDELRIAIGYMGTHAQMHVNDVDSSIDAVRGLVAGFVVPGSIGEVELAFGLGVHVNDERVSRSRSLPRTLPRWEFYDNRPHRTFLAAHLALRPVDWLLIGGGMAFQSTSRTDLALRGSLDYSNPAARSRLEHDLVGQLETLRYPQLGVQIVPNDWLSFGAVYRDEYRLSNELGAGGLADVTGFGPEIPPAELFVLIHTFSVNSFSPRQLSFGGSVTPVEGVTINAELTWVDWSDYEASIGASDVILTVEIPPELSDLVQVPDSINSTRPIKPGFRDRWIPRVGMEVLAVDTPALELRARAGYFYESSPVPNQMGAYNLIDTDRHAFSVGAGLALLDLEPTVDGFITLDAHFQWSILPQRLMIKESLVDTYGDYRADGQIFAAGLTAELGFD